MEGRMLLQVYLVFIILRN